MPQGYFFPELPWSFRSKMKGMLIPGGGGGGVRL